MAISYNIFLYNSKCTVPVFEMVPKKSDSRFFLNFANILRWCIFHLVKKERVLLCSFYAKKQKQTKTKFNPQVGLFIFDSM